MGLDMYLLVETYINDDKKKQQINEIMGIQLPESTFGIEVKHNVAYWRKANAVHNWFVQNVQNGVDDCESYYVGREQLVELRDLCAKIAAGATLGEKTKEEEKESLWDDYYTYDVTFDEDCQSLIQSELAPTSGFFFGGTAIDQYYYEDLVSTVEQLSAILEAVPEGDYYRAFEYQASW